MGKLDGSNLGEALRVIYKAFGKESIMRLGEKDEKHSVETFSSGSLALDVALGTGGFPRGRVVEIYGPESSGKTTIALMAAAQAQRSGGVVAFVDAEHALDPAYAAKLGVKLDDVLISQPDCGEQALEIVEILVRCGDVSLVVVDSVAALVPRAEIAGEMGDSHMGLQARLMSQALRKLTGIAHRTGTCVVFINQLRQKIGVVFGNPETTTGGNALKFYASVRLDVRRIGALKDSGGVKGNRTRVKVVKNKLAPPFTEAEFDILYGRGIHRTGELVDMGVDLDLIDKSGSWYSFEGERLAQGRDRVCHKLEENPLLLDSIESALRKKLGLSESDTPGSCIPEKRAAVRKEAGDGDQAAA